MANILSKDTQLCMSLAGRPGNFGTRFHNYLYQQLDLDFIYKAFTTQDIQAAIGGIRALGIRGCAISMPFKEVCIPYLDKLDVSAASIESVNTIVNDNGHLKAYNTDYIAVVNLLKENDIDKDIVFILQGSGGMAKAVAGALFDSGFKQGTIFARNKQKGQELARFYGYQCIGCESEYHSEQAKMLINVTPIGMAGGKEAQALAFSPLWVESADVIFDVVALPVETPLITYARKHNKKIISGAEVAMLQAIEQFVLYTGIQPDAALIQDAANFARKE